MVWLLCGLLIIILYVTLCLFWFSEKRQTVLFSATQTQNVEDLAKISLKKSPIYVGVDDHKAVSTVEGLEQVRGRDRVRGRVRDTCTCIIMCN